MDVSPVALVAFGITVLGAGTLIGGMIWQFISALRHG
jgi:hypothetical protein